jgi:hypothetical protein
MRKTTILLAILLSGLSVSAFAQVCPVKAQDSSFNVGFSTYNITTYPNQPVEINSYATGGTPPYTYQWRTEFIPQYILDSPYFPFPAMLDSRIIRVNVPGATSPTFNFVESTPGTYNVCLDINDSAGNTIAASTGPFIVVLQQTAPSPNATPTPPAPPPLNITIASPENKTYQTNNIPLNFSLSGPAEWTGYSIDGQTNITVNGNTTLTGTAYGSHTLTVYANDTNSNTKTSQTITFTINQPPPFPTAQAATATTVITALAVAGLGYSVKRRQRSKITTNIFEA